MGQYLGGETNGNTLHAHGWQEREFYRKVNRFLVTAVIG